MKKIHCLLSALFTFAAAQTAQAEWYGFKGKANNATSYWDVKGNWFANSSGNLDNLLGGKSVSNVHINPNPDGSNTMGGFASGWNKTVTFQNSTQTLGGTLNFCAGSTSDPIRFAATATGNGLTATGPLYVKDDYHNYKKTTAPCLEIQSGTYRFSYIEIGRTSGHTSTLVVNGGTLRTASGYSRIGVGGGDGVFTIKAGSFDNLDCPSDKYPNLTLGQDSGSSGTLNVQGGTFTVKGYISMNYNSGAKKSAVNISGGGVLEANRIYLNNAGTNGGTITIDGGTLKANGNQDKFLPAHASLRAYVAARGATIDTAGCAIAIGETLEDKSGETGFVRFTGGGSVALTNAAPTYTGKTLVAAGTKIIATKSIAQGIISHGLELSGIPELNTPYTILSSSDDLSSLALSNVTCGLDATCTAALGADGKSIVVTVTEIPALYVGPATGSLSDAENWSNNSVPAGCNAFIHCASAANLVKGDTFAPSSITFLEDSAAVAISGDGPISGVAAVTNLSASASHTFNVPVYFAGDIQVKQMARAEKDDLALAHVTFAGGAHAAPGHAIENGNYFAVHSRCMFGDYYLNPAADSPWTVPYYGATNRLCLASGSTLHVSNAKRLTELYVDTNAKVFVGDMNLDGRFMYQMKSGSEVVVTNMTTAGTGDKYLTYNQGTSVPGVFKFNCITNSKSANWLYFADGNSAGKHTIYIGEGGLNFANDSGSAAYCIGRTNANNNVTIRPWYSDFTIAARSTDVYGLAFNRDVTFCTDDERNVGRTITVNAKTRASASTTITVSGKGTLRVNNSCNNNAALSVTVKDKATLEYGTATATLGADKITLGAGTTFAFRNVERRLALPSPIVPPTTGAATLRINGSRLGFGDHTVISGVTDDVLDHLVLDPEGTALSDRRFSLRVEGGNLILNVKSACVMIYVR